MKLWCFASVAGPAWSVELNGILRNDKAKPRVQSFRGWIANTMQGNSGLFSLSMQCSDIEHKRKFQIGVYLKY